MPESPDQQWRQLTEHYARMWDDELLNLAADYNDLTDMAKQVLRDEMRKRKLADPAAPARSPKPARQTLVQRLDSVPDVQVFGEDHQVLLRRYSELLDRDILEHAIAFNNLTRSAQQALREEMKRRGLGDPVSLTGSHDPTDPESIARTEAEINARLETRRALHGDEERDYTWQTPLRDYATREEALQRLEMLNRAGIQCWFGDPDSRRGDPTSQRLDYRILVPADQLEEAFEIITQPVPQDIIDESKVEVPEYQLPHCPRCQDQEPTLIATEPSNQWLCESCGNQWNEPIAASH
jgi:hypothetical protein